MSVARQAADGRREKGSLAWLLEPVEPATFLAEFWERKPLLLNRGEPGYLDGLLTIADVDRFLGTGRVAYPTLRLIREGVERAPDTFEVVFENSSGKERLADPGKVAEHYLSGGTISLNQVHRVFGAVSDLCARLERDLSHAVETNLYLTPPNARGAPSHYDVVDVFVLQVEGRKTWRVYENPPVPLPLSKERAQRGADPGRTATPSLEAELSRGDVLYLPRGHVHEARTTGEASLHLTVVVDPIRYADLARIVVDHAARSTPGLRRALPPGFLGPDADLDGMRAELTALLGSLLDGDALADVLGRIRQKRRSSPRFLIGGRLLQAEAAGRATVETPVRRRAGLPLEPESSDAGLALQIGDRTLELPWFGEVVLDRARSDRPFRAADLSADLDPAAALAIIRVLVREGVLVVDPESPVPSPGP